MTKALLHTQTPQLPQRIELGHVPFFPQQQYQCGPAALATVLTESGVSTSPAELLPKIYLPARKGTLQVEILAATRRYQRLPYLLEPDLDGLLRQLIIGRPVLVLQNLGLQWLPQWHYAVVVGYDLEREQLLLRSGTIRQYRMGMKVFERTWQRASYWAMVVLEPGERPIQTEERGYFNAVADFEKHNPGKLSLEAYQAGLQLWPDSLLIGMGYANASYRVGQLQTAANSYRKVLSAHPDYAPAHNNLAHILMLQGHLIQAKAHAESALLSDDSHRQQYQSTLNEILLRLKQATATPRNDDVPGQFKSGP